MEKMLAALTPVKTEPFLSSEKLNLKGVPSKLVCFEGLQVPTNCKPGNSPDHGVWASDRIHVAALVLLLEAESGRDTFCLCGICQLWPSKKSNYSKLG